MEINKLFMIDFVFSTCVLFSFLCFVLLELGFWRLKLAYVYKLRKGFGCGGYKSVD